MGTKPNVVKEFITPPISKKNIDKVNKTEKSQASKKIDTSSSTESEKGKSLDKSRSTQRTETEDTVKTVNKSRSISSTSLSGKSTKIDKPSEIDISKYNSSISVLYVHGENLSSVTPDQQLIHCKNKRKKTSDASIT